jgi:hypothetical protein
LLFSLLLLFFLLLRLLGCFDLLFELFVDLGFQVVGAAPEFFGHLYFAPAFFSLGLAL